MSEFYDFSHNPSDISLDETQIENEVLDVIICPEDENVDHQKEYDDSEYKEEYDDDSEKNMMLIVNMKRHYIKEWNLKHENLLNHTFIIRYITIWCTTPSFKNCPRNKSQKI
jgi:hypothetical protein